MARHGRRRRDGRDRSDTIEYDQSKPIRGRFVFDDGTELPFTKARYVNGAERVVKCVEVDGVRFVPAPIIDYDDVEVD